MVDIEPRWPFGAPMPVDRLAAEIAELRPLPGSIMRIARLTMDDRFSAQELAALVACDPAITARLLRLANSAYYGFPRRIGTVRDAVVLVGLRAVRAVVLVACVMDGAATTPGSGTAIDRRASWRFAVAVGLVAEWLARDARVDPAAAFTAGVLHSVGLVALDQYRPEELRAALHIARSRGVALHEAEREVLGFTHLELGGALATRWNLPPDLVAAIRDHAWPLDALPVPDSLTTCVLRARLIARAYALPDGIERSSGDADAATAAADERVVTPAIARAVDRAGGAEGILHRADAFVEASLP